MPWRKLKILQDIESFQIMKFILNILGTLQRLNIFLWQKIYDGKEENGWIGLVVIKIQIIG